MIIIIHTLSWNDHDLYMRKVNFDKKVNFDEKVDFDFDFYITSDLKNVMKDSVAE
jgi:hypothetical protein